MRMMRRRRSEAGHSGNAQVLSAQDTGVLAKHDKSDSGLPKRPQSGHLQSGGIINAYWQKSDLVLVVHDDESANGIRFQRLKAEHSCFVKRADLEDSVKFVRMLNHHHAVRKAVWEGDWLRIVWQNRDALKHYCKLLHLDVDEKDNPKLAIPTYEGLVSPVLRYMVDNDLWPALPRQVWVDIETDSRVPVSAAIEGEARILCWVTDDGRGNQRRGMLNEDTDADEARLLTDLWDVLENYDQVMAWNGDRFDFPVIKARSERAKLLRTSQREWRRWLWLDHLDLFRRLNSAAAESGDEKTSFALDAVAMSLLGTGKHDFDASQTWQEWAAGGERRQALLDYCAQDTALMPRIEAKTGFIMILQTATDTCGTFPDTRGSNPGIQVEGFLARLARDRGHKFPTVLKRRTGDPYDGAHVLHPDKNAGVHRDVHVADFSSLYPTIIVTWNMSPETITDDPGGFPVAHSPLTKCNFRSDFTGILPDAVTRMMQLRKKWSDRQAQLPYGTDAWKDAERRSAAYKLMANAFYGVTGMPSSRHHDRSLAESVAQCGKWLFHETLKAAELLGMRAIYGDTDSIFVTDATRAEFEEFVQWCNAELYPRILKEQGCPTNRIKLTYEKQFDRLIFTTAKRYAGSVVHYKGTDSKSTSKPEIKGLEFKRGDSLQIVRKMQAEVVYRLVGYQSDEDPDDVKGFESVCARWLDHVMTGALTVDDISVSKRLNKALDDYKANSPMVRIAKGMDERGEDVGEGAKIRYVVIDACASPQEVMRVEDWDPDGDDLDRMALWDKLVWPPTQRLLEAAFPGHDWGRFTGLIRSRKALARAQAREVREAVKAADKAARAQERAQKKHSRQMAKGAPPIRRRRTV